MLSKKIIMCVSVPGLALVYGIYLYRRRKVMSTSPDDNLKKVPNGKLLTKQKSPSKNSNSGRKCNSIEEEEDHCDGNGVFNNNNTLEGCGVNKKVAYNINSSNKKQGSPENELCRSAPISIFPENKLLSGIRPLEDIEDDENLNFSPSTCSFTPSTVRLPGTPLTSRQQHNQRTRHCHVNDSKTEIIKASPIFKMSNFDDESLANSSASSSNSSSNNKEQRKLDEYNSNNINLINDYRNNNSVISQNGNRKCSLSQSTSSPPSTTTLEEEHHHHHYTNYKSSSINSPSSITSSENKNIKYEFILPDKFIGKFYGKNKKNLFKIKASTSTQISIKKHQFYEELKVCSIVGSQNDVYSALKLIRKILPKKQFPNLTLKRITPFNTSSNNQDKIVQLPAQNYLQLNLVEGINNDVIVTTVTAENDLLTLFVQQPLHPTHPFLSVLQSYLSVIYNEIEAPFLPQLKENIVCVGRVNKNWYRLQIVQVNRSYCFAKFVDYGGFVQISNEDLRQIRHDLLTIPFQAIECSLSNLYPNGSVWGADVPKLILDLASNMVLQAQVVGYTEDNIPEIYLFAALDGKKVLFINKELVARNVAEWID